LGNVGCDIFHVGYMIIMVVMVSDKLFCSLWLLTIACLLYPYGCYIMYVYVWGWRMIVTNICLCIHTHRVRNTMGKKLTCGHVEWFCTLYWWEPFLLMMTIYGNCSKKWREVFFTFHISSHLTAKICSEEWSKWILTKGLQWVENFLSSSDWLCGTDWLTI